MLNTFQITNMTDYRISVEEFESQAEIAEMAKSLVQEAFELTEEIPSILILTEEDNVPLLIK